MKKGLNNFSSSHVEQDHFLKSNKIFCNGRKKLDSSLLTGSIHIFIGTAVLPINDTDINQIVSVV